jgi:hypothetical protein
VTKRSPILGYNHNVRYRGLIFHVQTEDSGVLSPHLFTHLFHGGVIVSTRKLVYDAGANEEAIKALMQAQHKAGMKDLRRGAFDDKIDQYLGGTEGLEPRGADSIGAVDTAPVAAPRASAPALDSEPLAAVDLSGPAAVDLTEPMAALARPTVPEMPPLPLEDESPTLQGDDAIEVIAAMAPAAQAPGARAQTPPPIPPRAVAAKLDPMRSGAPPPIEIVNEQSSDVHVRFHDDDKARARPKGSDSQPPSNARPANVAASLPPVTRPPSRPSLTPPAVVSRPLTPPPVAASDGRPNRPADETLSDAVEVYAPAPPSAEPPPGEKAARPGQYSVNRAKRTTENIPLKDKTGRIATVPSGLMPPGRSGSGPTRTASPSSPPTIKPPSGQLPAVRPPTGPVPTAKPPTGPVPTVTAANAPPSSRPQSTSPIATRPAAPASNVVIARPAVIVGAPPKPATTVQRVRKAREDEGRGFGQGLISEKSLDEVILAYLSEDAKNEK